MVGSGILSDGNYSDSPRERAEGEPGGAPPTKTPGFDVIPETGVIYVMGRARECGFKYGHPEWSNLGQGAPECGKLEGAPERATTFPAEDLLNEYAPVAGVMSLRKAVAHLYNTRYREGMESQYTWKNVCITPGGRASLARIAAAFGEVNVGFFLPEYTAYEQLLTVFKKFVPIPTALSQKTGYHFSEKKLKKLINRHGLSALILSNPCNPTGQLIEGEPLENMAQVARDHNCAIVVDEVYSSYIYTHDPENNGDTVSIARYVQDVNTDNVVIIDGLTKNWRLPGWRVCWTLGPEDVIKTMASAGSFIEGGANHPLQLAALPLLDPDFARADSKVLQEHFRAKRDFFLPRLKEIGFEVEWEPQATFYVWASVAKLPAPLDNGFDFFENALDEKVICVPGIFFDVNPGKRRELFRSPYHEYVRLSMGPPLEQLVVGLDALERLVNKFR
eukprot:TRINITY_DN373_c0_g1_i2.p1 TRINITY_DN373_c0_g1~~TRINITY_DN373_c0_g1_i2.p1  ORF type:complete len:447 (+),score=95.05 TRINITY_DN373_c0_g1_i2:67-1407(+)